MFLKKLTLANLTTRKVRVALTVAAIALSVSLVVSVTGGYASIERTAFAYLVRYMGSHDGQITRSNDLRGTIDESVADEIAKDPDVTNVEARLENFGSILTADGNPLWPAHIVGIRRPQDRRVESMEVVEGGWFNSSDSTDAVIDQVGARMLDPSWAANGRATTQHVMAMGDKDAEPPPQMVDVEKLPHVHPGDHFFIPSPNNGAPLKMTVSGIVHKPAFFASQVQTVYVPLHTLQKFLMPDKPPQVSRILFDLKPGVNNEAFGEKWKARLAKIDPTLQLRMQAENRNKLEENLQSVHLLSYLGGAISMLAAAFIVFSALSMGVSERQRSLAMLRAIGALRGQLGWLVIAEGLLLALIGIAVGVPLGWVWLKLLATRFSDLFHDGVVLSWGGVAFASIGSLAAALAAGLLPAWSAMRTSPLEAMSPLATPASRTAPVWAAIAGLLLISIDPLISFMPWTDIFRAAGVASPDKLARTVVLFPHFVIGLPTLMAGFFLLGPLFVCAVERVLGPIVAAMFGLRFAMLRQQLSGGIWRAAGTAAALMVGLAVLVVMQTQGHTMLEGWKLPTRFPDLFIYSGFSGGLTHAQVNKIRHIEGINPKEVLPIAIASPEYGSSIVAIYGAAVMPNATMFFGIDPDLAFKMMELDFRDGNPDQAAAMLKEGRHVVITEELHQLKGLKVGDKLPLKTPRHGVVDYTVAGVVWSPGIDVMVSNFDLGRQFDQRTAASVFGSMKDAEEDFGVQGVYLIAVNLQGGISRAKLTEQINKKLGTMGLTAYDIRHIKHAIQQGFARLLLLVSTVAFAAMAVASLGVTNTIMASIRSRRWQFGILRSIGVTRSQLLRLVLAEALLLGFVGCSLGLAAGLEMSIDARQEAAIVVGYKPPVAVPWGIILIGTGVVLAVSILASLAPAVTVARSEPLELLQAGRAAT